MWNVLTDEFPTEWNGYPIDGNFETGILISKCLVDKELSQRERIAIAIDLLFCGEKKPPDFQTALSGLEWFLNEFNHDNHKKSKSEVTVMDWDVDQWRIYAAFLSQYQIDLNTVKMHWFAFMGLLSNLNECAFTRVIDIRQKKIEPKSSSKERKQIIEAKSIYAIRKEEVVSESDKLKEQIAVEEFNKIRNRAKSQS